MHILRCFNANKIKKDGAFHKIKVKPVGSAKGAKVSHRPGFYAPGGQQRPDQMRLALGQQLMATSSGQVALRSIQTRAFDTTDRVKTLTTVIATLQDLEFLIDRADASLGVVSATKTKDRTQLRMSVSIHPRGSDQTLVRASGQFELEAVDDPEFYQQFFAALGRSMFLTAHDAAAPTGVSVSPSER